ncbi:PREDICTED: anoctamin-7-like [Priapulus caudatus]|uniref:Anoctamin n=1 Tax=Priapulus caudatus TaxID=37621 RepID=A0ABM1ETD9_PRICU|nr:PREDICTED: anoctamin-7-like [Priapulus caudatus]
MYSRISYLFDNAGTVFYAVFMSFWAVTFLEYWKRKSSSLAHHWDCMDFEEEEERPRPEFAARAPFMEKNPITGVKEPHFPSRTRLPRILVGVGAIIVMMCLVFIFIVAVIMYRCIITVPLFQNKLTRSQAPTIASLSSACVNLILIMALGKVYEKLALKLTQWEVTKIKLWFQERKLKTTFSAGRMKTRWEEDYQLIPNEGLFDEYLEMVLQFGFITIFVAAFPLAPVFALLNNWVEIRLDAHKFVCETRRTVAERCQNIGIWFHILDSIAQIAVISNAFVIAFTSEFLPRLLYQYEYSWKSEFENNLTFKVFIFQFVNFYSSIFYIAFFKGSLPPPTLLTLHRRFRLRHRA